MASSGEDLRSLGLDDAALSSELLLNFLDELNDADLPSVSSIQATSQLQPFGGYQTSTDASPMPVFGSFSVFNGGATPSTAIKRSVTDTADAALHFEPSGGHIDAELRSNSSTKALKEEKVGAPKLPMQNSTRKRQKEELNYLRDKVQVLEQELEAKKRELMASNDENKENKPLSVQIRGRRGRWQRIAKHQLVEKQRAEMQNLQLKQSLMDQLKLARSLQKLLKKNASRKDEETETAQLQARIEFRNYCSGESEDSLYETLLRDMDAVYAELGTICARHPVMQNLEEGSDVSSFHGGETDALYLEATNSKVVPFGMEETVSAVWRCLSSDHVKLADGTYHGMASTLDSIRAKAIMTLRVNNTAARMQMRFAMKKYVEQNRVVITLESASESEGPRDLLYGLKMMQRAWIVIRPVPVEPEDEEDANCELPSEETAIQLCMRLTPSLSAGVLGTPGQRTGEVTELLLAAVDRNLGWLFQTVENILMEHNFGAAPL